MTATLSRNLSLLATSAFRLDLLNAGLASFTVKSSYFCLHRSYLYFPDKSICVLYFDKQIGSRFVGSEIVSVLL